MKWSFRKLELKDSAMIFQWRNDPAVYQYFFHPEPVALENHTKWIEKTIMNPQVLFLVAQYESTPAGTVRFDFNADCTEAEVGIYLAPIFHGKGLGSDMLSNAEQFAKKNYPQLTKILAKVLVENIASEKMFEKTGYRKHYLVLEKKVESENE